MARNVLRLFCRLMIVTGCALLLLLALTAVSCGAEKRDPLAYQEDALFIEADFTNDGKTISAKIELDAPEYDENGRMLARSARFALTGNEIIEGVSFEFEKGRAFVVSGALRIPVEDERMLDGITSLLSLFSIDRDALARTEKVELDGERFILASYASGADGDSAEVLIDADTFLPRRITAFKDGMELSAEIKSIRSLNDAS